MSGAKIPYRKSAICLLSSVFSFTMAFGATQNIVNIDSNLVSSGKQISSKALNKLKSNSIEVVLTNDNKVVLKNKDKKSIDKANEILMSINATSSYPGSWIEEKQYSYITSKKFRAASEAAFLVLLTGWWVGGYVITAALAKTTAAAFATSYFTSRDEENIYYSKQYFYRELSAGSFDSIGNFIGDYQIKKIEKTSLKKDATGGEVAISYMKSSIITPSF